MEMNEFGMDLKEIGKERDHKSDVLAKMYYHYFLVFTQSIIF